MIGILVFAFLVPCLLARAETPMDCLPPVPPTPVTDHGILAEYRDEIAAEYSDYFDEAQTYLRCLDAARTSVTEEVNQTIADYRRLGTVPDD
jgi:hypothetical protein